MKKYLLLTLAFGAGFISSSIINNSTLSSQEEKVEYKIRKNLNAETVSAECMINGQAQQDTVVCEQISYGSRDVTLKKEFRSILCLLRFMLLIFLQPLKEGSNVVSS
jgi:hypothetical protein